MRDISSLSENDFKILGYIRSHEPATIEDVERALPEVDSVPFRITQMQGRMYRLPGEDRSATINRTYLRQECEQVTDEHHLTHIKSLGTYTLTDLGRAALQDYELTQKSQRRELWLKNAWIPILVTIATTLVIRTLEWLFPLIRGWFSSTP